MTKEEINKLIEEFQVPKHVQSHCEKVAKVAIYLARKLIEKGEKIDLELLETAAYLHDLVRVVDFKTFTPDKFPNQPTEKELNKWCELRTNFQGKHHADAACEILCTKKYPELAEMIKKHKFLSIINPKEIPKTWEEKLLFYADKRVNHDQIVTLKERFETGRQRNTENKITKEGTLAEKKIYELEKEIFEKIQLSPDVLTSQLHP